MTNIEMPTHYKNIEIKSIDQLRSLFPEGQANYLNFVLFSTDGIHGSNDTIEDCENAFSEGEKDVNLTVLVIRPRIVSMVYGHVKIDFNDISYLKKLRESSFKVLNEFQIVSKKETPCN